jgi:hypothetical protein
MLSEGICTFQLSASLTGSDIHRLVTSAKVSYSSRSPGRESIAGSVFSSSTCRGIRRPQVGQLLMAAGRSMRLAHGQHSFNVGMIEVVFIVVECSETSWLARTPCT